MNAKLSKGHMTAIKWLLKAVSTDKDRETLQLVNVVAPGVWEATDGWKIHRLMLKPNETASFKELDIASRDGFASIMTIATGLYRIKVDGNFLMVEKDGDESKRFPDTSVIITLNRKLSRKLLEKQGPNDLDVCHLAVNPVLLAETLAGLKDVVRAHMEIGQTIHVQATGEWADYFAIVMPMHAAFEEYGMSYSSPQMGQAVWKPGMKLTEDPAPAEAEAEEPQQVESEVAVPA